MALLHRDRLDLDQVLRPAQPGHKDQSPGRQQIADRLAMDLVVGSHMLAPDDVGGELHEIGDAHAAFRQDGPDIGPGLARLLGEVGGDAAVRPLADLARESVRAGRSTSTAWL